MSTDKNKKIEDILASLDGVGRVSAPDFFYTRLKARMEKELVAEPKRSWILKPVFAFSALILILAVNAVLIFSEAKPATSITETDYIQSAASAYSINTNLTYEINQLP